MDFDWKSIVASVAPVIGTALGGPLAGTATKLLAGAILGDDTADGAAVQAAVSSGLTTDQIAAIKRADQEFAVTMRQMDIKLEELAGADRASARSREVATRDWTPKVLAFVIIGGFFATVTYVLGYGMTGMDAAAAAFAGTLVGYVSAKAEQVVSYYFGSSSGSDRKNRAIEQALSSGAR